MIDLPESLVLYTMSYLDYKDTMNLHNVNNKFNRFVIENNRYIWDVIFINFKDLQYNEYDTCCNLKYKNYCFSFIMKKMFNNKKEAFIEFKKNLKLKDIII